MTKEEYIRLTAYTSVEQANVDLQKARTLLIGLLLMAIITQYAVFALTELSLYLTGLLLLAEFTFFTYVIYFCRTIIQKTKNVSLAQIGYAWMFLLGFAAPGFALVIAPMSYLWFVMPLTAPLEIIVGRRQPPGDIQRIEFDRTRQKSSNASALRTIAIVSLIMFAVLATMSYLTVKGTI